MSSIIQGLWGWGITTWPTRGTLQRLTLSKSTITSCIQSGLTLSSRNAVTFLETRQDNFFIVSLKDAMTCIDRKFSAFYSDIYMYGSMAVISWFSAASDWVLKSKNPISVTMRGQPTMILLSWSWKTRLISKSFPGLWHLCVFLTPRESTMARRWQKSFWNNWPIQWYMC